MGSLALNPSPQAQPDHRDRVIRSLEEEVRDLNVQLVEARRQLESQRSESTRAIRELRRQLSPLFQALRAVFGEIDVIMPNGASSEPAAAMPDKKRAVWESWKQKLPGNPAKVIDALLLHGDMNTQQIAIAIGCHRNNVPKLIYKLSQAGLIDKNGGRFSLKEL